MPKPWDKPHICDAKCANFFLNHQKNQKLGHYVVLFASICLFALIAIEEHVREVMEHEVCIDDHEKEKPQDSYVYGTNP